SNLLAGLLGNVRDSYKFATSTTSGGLGVERAALVGAGTTNVNDRNAASSFLSDDQLMNNSNSSFTNARLVGIDSIGFSKSISTSTQQKVEVTDVEQEEPEAHLANLSSEVLNGSTVVINGVDLSTGRIAPPPEPVALSTNDIFA
ncbi:unnamed protein product, partial [Amoebophrya sp. A120]